MPPPSSFRRNHNVVWDCTYHVVFCPKYRRPVLREPIAVRLKGLIRRVAGETQSDVGEPEVLPTLWTNAWFVSAVGGAPLAAIERYVADQKGR